MSVEQIDFLRAHIETMTWSAFAKIFSRPADDIRATAKRHGIRKSEHARKNAMGASKIGAKNPHDCFEHYVLRKDGCWEWIGSHDWSGYSTFVFGGRRYRAHRVSWEVHNGPIPNGLLVLHHCDNPPCSNPEHLFLGTQSDNMADMAAKVRSTVGVRHPMVKLTEDEVQAIRRSWDAGETQLALGRKYKVNNRTICSIVRGQSWRHLPWPTN